MGWANFGTSVQDVNKTSNTQTNASGTNTPILSNDWQSAFNNAKNNLNSAGYTADQQTGVDWARNSLANNQVQGATGAANASLTGNANSLQNVIGGYNYLAGQGAHQLGAAPTEGYVGDVKAASGNSLASQYYNPFQKNVIDTSVNDYMTGVDRTQNAMRAGRDSAGAFGDRSAVADAVYQGDATRGLGSLVSGLYSQGFNTAQGYGQQDANRLLSADQGNQAAAQGVNTRNSSLLDSRERANIGYQQDDQALKMNALAGIRSTELEKAGVTDDILKNVITADGIDSGKAQALFQTGQISQEQLNAIMAAASAGNGSSFNQTGGSSTNSNEITAKAAAGIGKVS